MVAKRPTTNDNIRDLIDSRFESLRLELKGDIKDVSAQVTILSKTVVNNEIKQAVSSTKIGMLITGITLVGSAITTIVMDKLTGRMQ